jgi:FixJ family two-component response regulator
LDTQRFIAIVDDDEDVRLAILHLVRSFGWNACVFGSGKEFLCSGQVEKTSCLITDVLMPSMSGIEMHDRVLALGYAPPTIFITAYPTANLQAKVNSKGVLVVLPKPLDADEIEHWISLALGDP